MYSSQALWTQARAYGDDHPAQQPQVQHPDRRIQSRRRHARPHRHEHARPRQPNLDWVKLANGMGVEAAQATTLEACADLMRQSFQRDGPFLIELMI
jgi:acetolactate synthase-1/2/3 large subunit